MTFENIAARAERGELRLIAGEVSEPACPLVDRGGVQHPHAIDAVREEQPAIRVHQPPFALHLFRAEKAGRLELWTSGPAPILIPIFRAGQTSQVFGFCLATALEVGVRFDLARPIFVAVLAKGVDKGEEGVGIRNPRGGRLVAACRANILNPEEMVRAGLADEDEQLGDATRIDAARAASPHGIASHPKELSPELIICSPRQRHPQTARLPRLERQRVRHAVVGAVGARVIHPAKDRDRVSAEV